MAKTTIQYVDRKGEPGVIQINAGTFSAANFVAYLAPLSMAGFTSYSVTTETAFTNPPATRTDALVNNDKDFKAILGFEGAEGHFKITLPCPGINVEGGLIIRWSDRRAYVPPVKVAGELGKDGADLVTIIQNVTGLTGLKFVFGRLIKKS